MKYLRFVTPSKTEELRARAGFFCAAYTLREDPSLDRYTADRLEDLLQWFRTNLPISTDFDRKGKDFDAPTFGLSWFKEDAKDAIAQSFELLMLLAENGHVTDILRAERFDYIIYQDDLQAVAEPFADTLV